MKRVLLIATTTGYQLRSFGDAAHNAGVTLLLATDRCDHLEDPWRDDAVSVRFSDARGARDAILAACGGDPPDAVIAVGDRPTVLAAHLNAAFGLPGNPPPAAVRSRNKLQAREAFQQAGLHVPEFHAVSLADDPHALATSTAYPAVLKPLALSGSRGVMRVDSPREFVAAFRRLRTLMKSPDILIEKDAAHEAALVESFVPGREFAVEGVMTGGVFRAFTIFDKPDPLDGPFFEETIYVTPSRQPPTAQQRIIDAVGTAARALGLEHGPVHGECRVNDTGVYVLEAAARPIGGICARALRFVTADSSDPATSSLEDVLLRHALGEDVSTYQRERRAAGVMMIPIPRRGILREVQGVDAARALPGVDDVRITAKQDALVVPLPEGRSYLGFIFAHGEHAAAAEQTLRAAHGRLRFVVDREIPVL